MNQVLGKFVFDDPTKLVYGEGVLKELPEHLKAMGATSVMLVCDQGIVKAGIADKVADLIKKTEGVKLCLFDKIMANPLDTIMDEGFEFARENNVDVVVGLGGGSSLDSAKGIALLMTNGGKLREYLMEGKEVTEKIAPTICIPTTAGTGSEVTRTVVATDHVTRFKDGFKNPDTIVADVALLDPELMATLPSKILAACGMDALTHAIESYTSWKANPVTDSLNLHAIKLIGANIRKAFAQPANLDAKGRMLLASCMTGIAFDQAGLGIAHCMGHPLGGLYDVPHGVACAMTLPVTMKYNLISCPEKMADIAVALGENIDGCTSLEAGEKAIVAVQRLMQDLDLPMRLSDLGIGEDAIPKLAEDAMGFPGMRGANPRDIDQAGMEKLFRELL
jgi:alcohol dehydrogenase class IV